jgi:hypothetical protein
MRNPLGVLEKSPLFHGSFMSLRKIAMRYKGE